MFGSTVLEIALGVTFIYLMLSLICSALQELIASLLKLRSAHLRAGIQILLGSSAATALYSHPFIKTLQGPGSLPSYIPPRFFANALLDVVAPLVANEVLTVSYVRGQVEKLPEPHLKKILLILLSECGDDIGKARESIEQWFSEAMDRVSGWYKRQTHTVIFVIAVIVTVLANADTLMIVNALAKDSALRTTVANHAEAFVRSIPPVGAEKNEPSSPAAPLQANPDQELVNRTNELASRVHAMDDMGLKLGWKLPTTAEPQTGTHDVRQLPSGFGPWANKILGLVITACAVSLGAPFWFDMLNKIITVRAAGKTPAEAKKNAEQ